MKESHPAIERVVVLKGSDTPEVERRARDLAAQLSLPLTSTTQPEGDIFLSVSASRLELRFSGERGSKPISVDFGAGAVGHDIRTRAVPGDRLLLRAVKGRGGVSTVIDATAGLGRDAFVLAARGLEVTAVERSPVVAALLIDGLNRAMADSRLAKLIDGRLDVVAEDAMTLLIGRTGSKRPDVVYLDPMFPSRRKSALVKKDMRLLRRVVGDDGDAGELLRIAREAARRRVVVKRMHDAPALADDVTRAYRGKTVRFDVYESNEPTLS